MTLLDGPRFNGPGLSGDVLDVSSACAECACGGRESDADRPLPGFDTAIAMAEAAGCANMTWWNTIRAHAADPAAAEYAASVLLAQLITSSAHRMGVPAADAWVRIRQTGRLPQ
ncbi:hypothetical protein AAFP35_09355 [Gordonia sp. CPCC 206044]|uniref:hypothetical protein n=1 Tax=Gordonia sp. CPCC 206044 TaxID=3140793 RepID=UPI003AF35C30